MREELPGRPCSVAATLSLIGEKWSLLAIREISFGNRRFDQIARNTGAPRDRLAARLRALEAGGVITRRQYSEHPARYEYELTAAGDDLRTVLTALRTWGDKWVMDAPPSEFTHSCGHEIDTAIVCRHCDTEVTRQDVRMRVLVPGWDRQGPAALCQWPAATGRPAASPSGQRTRKAASCRWDPPRPARPAASASPGPRPARPVPARRPTRRPPPGSAAPPAWGRSGST